MRRASGAGGEQLNDLRLLLSGGFTVEIGAEQLVFRDVLHIAPFRAKPDGEARSPRVRGILDPSRPRRRDSLALVDRQNILQLFPQLEPRPMQRLRTVRTGRSSTSAMVS